MSVKPSLQANVIRFAHQNRDGLVSLAVALIEARSPSPPGDERAVARVALD